MTTAAKSPPGPTERQATALRWIDSFPHTKAAWLVNGKKPTLKQSPATWNQMELSGDEGSIRIWIDDWRAIGDMITPAPDKTTRIWA